MILSVGIAYVNKNEFVYALSPVASEPIAGKVAIPQNQSYLGMSFYQHSDFGMVKNVQTQIGKNLSIVGYYQAWGGENNQFDLDFAKEISNNGSIPLITWEPWKPVGGYDRTESSIDQKEYRLSKIVDGNFDPYIISYAQAIEAYKKPVMIRFAHEMNGNWYPWGSTLGTYLVTTYLAHRHIHEIFDSVGATNATWIWSPNEIYTHEKVPNADKISTLLSWR